MSRSFIVFLVGVVGGTAWLFLQKFSIQGLQDVRLTPRQEATTGQDGMVPISVPAARPRETIRVASFNIQVFGRKKLENPVVMEIVTRIVQQFDIVAIQEIRASENDILPRFIDMLNAGGRHFDFVIGPRLGRTSSKEQYAFVFDQESIEVDRSQLYTIEDRSDALHREPLVGWFRARGVPPEQAFTFSLVNIHTDPDEVAQEVDVLDNVFYAVRNDPRQEDDVILLGDLNADDRHLGELGRMPNIYAAISNVATNTAGTKQYDNLVFDRQATVEFSGRAGVFDFLRAYGLTIDAARDVSDHLPVWAEFSAVEGGQFGRVARVPGQ
jgi:endonuclease/exonuclease/phosphatase family metal-dependent hydrolase